MKYLTTVNKLIKIILLLIIIFPSLCFSEPAPTGYTGIPEDGNSVTITGTGFLTKSPAAPISFIKTNIDAGTPGVDVLSTIPGYEQVTTSDVNAQYSNTKSHGGNSILFPLTEVDGWSQLRLDTGTDQEEIYFSMYFRIDYDGDCTEFQYKPWRLNSGTDYSALVGTSLINDWWWSVGSQVWYNSGTVQAYYNSGTKGEDLNADQDAVTFDEWQRLESYNKHSTASTADGITNLTRTGTAGLMLSTTAAITRDADDPLWRYIRFGQAISDDAGCSGSSTWKIYLDDIYVDDTKSRVEIGNASTHSACTEMDVQPQTAHASSGDSIKITVNQGLTPNGATRWVYVIDLNGAVNTNGLEITFGESPEASTSTNSSTASRF